MFELTVLLVARPLLLASVRPRQLLRTCEIVSSPALGMDQKSGVCLSSTGSQTSVNDFVHSGSSMFSDVSYGEYNSLRSFKVRISTDGTKGLLFLSLLISIAPKTKTRRGGPHRCRNLRLVETLLATCVDTLLSSRIMLSNVDILLC